MAYFCVLKHPFKQTDIKNTGRKMDRRVSCFLFVMEVLRTRLIIFSNLPLHRAKHFQELFVHSRILAFKILGEETSTIWYLPGCPIFCYPQHLDQNRMWTLQYPRRRHRDRVTRSREHHCH